MTTVFRASAAAVALTSLGLVAGWLGAGSQRAPDAEEPAAGGPAAPVLSEQALRNLGVTFGEAALGEFVKTRRIQARVVDAALNERPVTTGVGGVVAEVHVRPGSRVRPGDPLVTLVRAAIPRPELPLTGGLLPSLSEDLHAAVSAFLNARGRRDIAQRELERIRRFTVESGDPELPVLPRKVEIDLEYELATTQQQFADARREMGRHGLTAEEIDAIGDDAPELPNEVLWRRALAVNGFWGEAEDAVLAALPEGLAATPWVVGALGELAASGRRDPGLARAVRETPALAANFTDALCLLLSGHTTESVTRLAELGELGPTCILTAPPGPPDWDVERVEIRTGIHVPAGAVLVVLDDARTMWLSVEPVGDEIAAVTRACETGLRIDADPLIPGSGPALRGLLVDRIATRSAGAGPVALIACENTALPVPEGAVARSWALREGTRYLVRVPVERFENRIVLPATAVVQHGLERAVLVRDGDTVRVQPVHVEYEDEDVAVIAYDGSLSPGDPVCLTGAFELALGLEGSAGADPHAGHDH